MTWQASFLSAVAILAGLLFIVGWIQTLQASRSAARRRRKKLRDRRRRTPIEVMMEAALPPPVQAPVQADGNGTPPQDAPVPVLSWAATLADRQVAWPTRRPAAPTVAEIPGVAPSLPAEPGPVKTVAHYADGKILKGFIQDFYPSKPFFHLVPATTGFSSTDEVVKVRIEQLKAVFFVRDFAGNPSYNERKSFAAGERPPGRKVRVVFKDGEWMVGSTVGYEPRRPAFFLTPADPQSNNRSVFAVAAAVVSVRFL